MISSKSNLPLVVLFGHANVGKSTLFNALTEKTNALVSKTPGTTRDANLGEVEWQSRKFTLVDTGGVIDYGARRESRLEADEIDAQVQKQARSYLERASLILYLVDAHLGLMPQDKETALMLKKQFIKKTGGARTKRSSGQKVILVANKADTPALRQQAAEFNKLALGEPAAISAASGSGTGDLLDMIVDRLPANKKKSALDGEEDRDKPINVCIIGQPNVGKSSLVNAILGENRIIVSSIPHTTREPQDILIEHGGQAINLIDTAGISKRGKKRLKN